MPPVHETAGELLEGLRLVHDDRPCAGLAHIALRDAGAVRGDAGLRRETEARLPRVGFGQPGIPPWVASPDVSVLRGDRIADGLCFLREVRGASDTVRTSHLPKVHHQRERSAYKRGRDPWRSL